MMLWMAGIGLLLLALVFVAVPFIREHETTYKPSLLDANVAVFRDTEAMLEAQLKSGDLDLSQHQVLLAEAQQLLISNTEQIETHAAKQAVRAGTWLLPAMLLSIPLLTYAIYHNLGASADQHITELIQRSGDLEPTSSEGAELAGQLYDALEKRVVERPDNIYYWAMLAQQTLAKGDIQAASDYYREAIEVIPNDGYLLAQYAETLFILANSQFTATVLEAIDRAFAIDSSNPTILGLKGIEAFEDQQWQLAITYWQGAMQQIDQNSVTASALQDGIARAEAQLQQTDPAQQSSSDLLRKVKLLVSIDPTIAYRPEQSVFVALVATTGPPMPLAARKLRAGDLPIQLSLSDADAVMAGHNLSSVNEFKAVARLSQSGSATPQSGDWEVAIDAVQIDSEPGIIELIIAKQRQ